MGRVSTAVGTVCGAGYAPVAPGTVGSLVAAAAWYLWYPSHTTQWVVCAVVIAVGWWAAHVVSRRSNQEDPSEVIIDEVAGMWLALAALPRTVPVVVIAFLLFRALDITKIPPMKQLERVPGGSGIMLDDLAAGLITHGILVVGLRLWGG